jgi:RNA polymerase sigma factor (sigma-70 family)
VLERFWKKFYDKSCILQSSLITAQYHIEEELVLGLQNNQASAFEHLYGNYKIALLNVIGQIISAEDDANDCLQDVFIAIHRNIAKYEPQKGRLFTWMHTLARNTAINMLRSKNFKQSQKNEDLTNVVYNSAGVVQQQNTDLIGLRKQVHLLREDYKNVLELSYFTGFTQEEIAQKLEIPIGTVKTRLRNAIIELRKTFK